MLKADRVGLVIVVASLLAITAIVFLLFQKQHASQMADIRTQGVSLARAISGVPYEHLVPGGQQQGVVKALHQGAASKTLAYVTISDLHGLTVSEEVTDGVTVPRASIPIEPSASLGDTEHTTGADQYTEFRAPLLQDGELKGFVRLGYFSPAKGLSIDQVPFLAMVALPVFLLTPLFYFLLRVEFRPVKAANDDLSHLIDEDGFRTVEVSASTDPSTDFVSHLSHELKSPLNVLGLYSESLLGAAGKSREFQKEAANVIAAEVDRLGTLITGLLNMTQIESGRLSPNPSLVNLQDVVDAAVEEAKANLAEKDCTFKLNAPKEVNPVLVDKNLIRIAIGHLLSNAVKYNKDNGKVTVTLEDTEDAVQIRVADTGIGVSDEEEAKIFNKFYRSTDKRVQAISGHGLGLALARQIVELHHGTLLLNRENSKGAEFIVNLWTEATAVRQAV